MLSTWLWINLKIGALSFGGAGRMLLYQDAVVREHAWITEEEFFEILTVAQLLPGPNLVNLSAYLSNRLFQRNWVSAAGVILLGLPGAFLGVAVVALVNTQNPILALLFQGFSLGSIALFLVFIARMVAGLKSVRWKEAIFARRVFVAIVVAVMSVAGVPLWWNLAAGIALALLLEFRWLL